MGFATSSNRTRAKSPLLLLLAFAGLLASCTMVNAVKTLDATERVVRADFPFESKYAEVLGSLGWVNPISPTLAIAFPTTSGT